jgi:hypothetical protein
MIGVTESTSVVITVGIAQYVDSGKQSQRIVCVIITPENPRTKSFTSQDDV